MSEARSTDNGIRYEVVGGGPPLLLLHPGLCAGSLWRTLGYAAALQDRFRLLIPDLRGHGGSPAPHDQGGYDVDAMRDDIGAMLDAEELSSAHCWGFSLGGLLAIRFAAAYPGRLRSLIAGAAIGYLPDAAIGTGTVARLQNSGLESIAPPLNGDSAVLPLRPVIIGQDLQAQIARYNAQANWPPPPGLEQLRLPLLLYVGERDSFAAPVQELSTALPHAKLITVPGMGHLQLWSHPEAIMAQALAFLDAAELQWLEGIATARSPIRGEAGS